MMYAQNGEDDLIWQAVYNYDPTAYSFIDIGAYDGETRSNTLLLSRHGWKGILVEPSPIPFKKLSELHYYSSHVMVNAALGPINSVAHFWPSEDGIGTTVKDHYDKWRQVAKYGEQIIVRQVSFAGLRQMNKELFDRVQVLSIDTEGSSVELLETFPFYQLRPKVVCIEHDNLQNRVSGLLVPLGYKLKLENPENMVFVV